MKTSFRERGLWVARFGRLRLTGWLLWAAGGLVVSNLTASGSGEAFPLRIQINSNQTATLSWAASQAGRVHLVQFRDSLSGTQWFACPSIYQWPVAATNWTVTNLAAAPSRFYRVVASAPAERGKLLSSTLVRSMSQFEIALTFSLAGIGITPQSGVRIYKLVYETVDPYGMPTRASGALVLPESPTGALPLVSYQHGTLLEKSSAPSAQGQEVYVAVAFASTGYAAVAPDYLGLGDSPGLHPYHHARSEATAVIDMLRVARRFCASNNLALNQQLFLCGYSQGGHATMAAVRELEAHHATEFVLTASAPMAGAYDLSGVMADDFLSGRTMPNPYYFAYLLAAYQGIYHLSDAFSDLLDSPYGKTIPPLLDGQHGGGDINQAMPADAIVILKPEELLAFRNEPEHPLRVALRDNDLYQWTPQAPMRLYHCRGDRDVLIANSEVAYQSFLSRGAKEVALVDPLPTADHGGGFYPCLLHAKIWFDGMKQ